MKNNYFWGFKVPKSKEILRLEEIIKNKSLADLTEDEINKLYDLGYMLITEKVKKRKLLYRLIRINQKF